MMDGTRDLSVFVRGSGEAERAAMAMGLAGDLLEHLDPEDLPAVLRQADTRLRRDLLHSVDLPYKQPPSVTVCRLLIERLRDAQKDGKHELLPRFGQVLRTAYTRRLRQVIDGGGLVEMPTESVELLEWAAHQVDDIPPAVLAYAVVDWLMKHEDEPVSPFLVALLHHVQCTGPVNMSAEGTRYLEDILETEVAGHHDDVDLRLARHLADSSAVRWPDTRQALLRLRDFAEEATDVSLLDPIREDLELLADEAQRQRRIITRVSALDALAHDRDLTIEDVASLIADLEAEARDRADPVLGAILRLTGPEEHADTLAEIRALATDLVTSGRQADSGLAALATVATSEGGDSYKALETFVHAYPQWTNIALAAASGRLSVAPVEPKDDQAVVGENPDGSTEPASGAVSGDQEPAEPTPSTTTATVTEPEQEVTPARHGRVASVDASPSGRSVRAHPADAEVIDVTPAETHGEVGETEIAGDATRTGAPNEDTATSERSAAEAALARALTDGRFGLASHLAATDGDADRELAFGLAALATEARAATGPCSARFKEMLDEVDDLSDLPARLVLLPAAIRMSLIAPYCGASSLAARLATTLPQLEPLVDAAVRASQQGVALIEDVLAVAADLSEAAQRVDSTSAAIRHHLDTAPARTIKYQRATDAWKALISSGGVLHDFLAPALATYTSDADLLEAARTLRSKAARLGTAKVRDTEIAAVDRRRSRKAIHSGAANRLAEYWDESVRVGVAWADAVVAANSARTTERNSWQQRALDSLRQADGDSRDPVDAALEALDDGGAVLHGAVCAARSLLDSVRDLLSGLRPEGEEQDPDRVLNVDLLACPEFRLDGDFTIRSTPETPATCLLEAVELSPIEGLLRGFDDRINALDHVGTALIVDVLQDLACAEADVLEQRRTEALSEARAVVSSRWTAARDRLESDRRLGFLDETTWRSWAARLSDFHPADRDDLDRVDQEITATLADLDDTRSSTIADFKRHLDDMSHDERVAAVHDRIVARIDDGDLATAWEYLSLAREGSAIPEATPRPASIEAFYPDVDNALTEVNVLSGSSRRVIVGRGRLGPLDFGDMHERDIETLDAGLAAWRSIARTQDLASLDWNKALTPVLRMLGLSAQMIRPSAENRPRAQNHRWVDLTGVEIEGDPLVPTFAPEPGGHALRKVLVNQGPAESVDGHIARSRISDPIMVLHLGPLGAHARRAMARAFRDARRAVAVIDDNLLAWIAATAPCRFDHTMRGVLPFVTTNPYMPDAYGLVPESMFYGRTAELDQIIRQKGGTSYVYGGRQLGKSALLRHAKRVFESTPAHAAMYLDLKAKQVGRPRPADAVWEELWTALAQMRVVHGDMPARRLADRIASAIAAWLDEEPGRRLLILLDECDQFIEADTKGDLAVSARLKGLMEETDRRCKIVFAGLHTVQRFASVARGVSNTPLAHLGDPLAIGPLDGRHAADLVTQPLTALGYEFESFDLVNRVLAHTNRHPALLVIFMHHLLERLNARSQWRNRARPRVTAEDIDSTWADPTVTAAIRERVSLTLRLDPAFHVIAHVVAYNHHVHGHTHRTPAAELRDDCATYWPAGFAGMQMADFTLIADEMIGLGVLAKDGNSYMLRSPNVSRLLGTRDEIEAVLLDASSVEPAETFEPSRWRRDMTPTGTRRSRPVRSPLTDAQLADIAANDTQVRLVAATRAAGLERVPDAISLARSARAHFAVRKASDPNITSYFRPLGDGRHRVTVVTIADTPPELALDVLAKAVDAVNPDRRRNPRAGTFSIVFVADPLAEGRFVRQVIGTEHFAAAVPVTAVHLWSREALANFGRDTGLPFDSSEAAQRVLDTTGGWDSLVSEVAEACAGGSPLSAALEGLDVARLTALLDLRADPMVAAAYRAAATYIDDSADPITDVAAFVADDPDLQAMVRGQESSMAMALVEQMVLAGLLVDVGDGRVRVERVVKAAFGRLE